MLIRREMWHEEGWCKLAIAGSYWQRPVSPRKGTSNMSVKLQNTRNLLRKNLQGMMESQRILKGNVEKLVDNPAELQKLLSADGDKFDTQTKAAIAQLLGGNSEKPAESAWKGQTAYAAQSPHSLLIGEKSEATQTWWSTMTQVPQLELPEAFQGVSADVEIGEVSFSQIEVEDLLRNLAPKEGKGGTPFVDAEQVWNAAQQG
ncbi:MAG: hypothetical protein GY822_00580 [Deltaproteobacteria bacterium]|nr:hypothetical protein [Deltaproteobacteria bacterium]